MQYGGTIIAPKQKIKDNEKNKKWKEECMMYFTSLVFTDTSSVRKRKMDVNSNYNIVVGKMDNYRLNKVLNPMQLEGAMGNYPTLTDNIISIINPAIKTLVGEEFKRGIDYKVQVINQDAISEKEEMIKKGIAERLSSMLEPLQQQSQQGQQSIQEGQQEQQQQPQQQAPQDDDLEAQISRLMEWKQYEAQDARERMATHLLAYYWEQLKLKYTFNDGFKDVLIAAEEIYRIDIVGKEPRVVRCNPLDVYTIRSTSSVYIEDSDAIIEDGYMSPGMIISEFGAVLTDMQISNIYDGSDSDNKKDGMMTSPFVAYSRDVQPDYENMMPYSETDNSFSSDSGYRRMFRNNYGEYRVMRVYWRSLREVYVLTYIDQESGEQLQKILDGNLKYKVDKNKGETLEKITITEWWQGIRIGSSIFVDIKPCPVQRRDINNPYISYPPYVGTIYNTNDRIARSLVDELKPIQEEWTIHKKRAEMLWARNMGKLVRIDISKIPSLNGNKKDLNMFMSWLYQFGIILENPFEEGGKGNFAGTFQSSVSSVDAELASSIAQTLEYLKFLQDLADNTSGISQQRRGEGAASEGLGVTQERIVRSTHQTEEWFSKHDYTKIRVLEVLLETTKYCMNNGNLKLQYILDDLSIAVLNVDVEKFKEADYGIKVVSNNKISDINQQIDKLAEYSVNAGTPLSEVVQLKLYDSLSEKLRALKKSEQERAKNAQDQQQQQLQMQQQIQQMQMQHEKELQQFEMSKLQMQLENRLQIERMKIEAGAYKDNFQYENDTNRNGILDDVEIKKQELANKANSDTLRSKEQQAEKDRRLEAEQKERDRKNKLEVERLKAKFKPTINKQTK